MKVGIIGLPQTGKKAMFTALTGSEIPEHVQITKPMPGSADILDPRFDALVAMYEPKKEAHAKIDFSLLPKLEKETIAKGTIFQDIADMDAICHIVRAFENESVFHIDGDVNPLRDIESINSELILHDLVFIEKRLERVEANMKKIKDENNKKEHALLTRMRAHLEAEKPLRHMEISDEEWTFIRSYPFITLKEMVIVLNVGENEVKTEPSQAIKDFCEREKIALVSICAGIESQIALLDDPEEKQVFMDDLGIEEPALGVLTRSCLNALGKISFFTVGKDEVRQWIMRKGASAPNAAGTIHSDLERGFIRAETIKYAELMAAGSEAELKKLGKIYVNGKDYIVEDGDILNIRFKV
ncbi:redox-regulated ATPase YchF [Desulforegula conservatrix]|uniref:redox-regulated ATPase YchF n=1 Tax=Desulforegula conservatrix TaxID=153026 RepID=UPI0003F84A57|nr:redox-regulated ATPase YchF [Desulforegula conservatrix]